MVQTVAVIPVFLLLLQVPAAPCYVPSACYTFTITPKPSPGQSWCEVQGQFIRGTFFNYTCSSQKFEPIGTLGMKLNATDFWNQLVERWKELVEELRKALLDYKQNISKAHPFSLQGSMTCQLESNGHRRVFWEFSCNGQSYLRFESKDRSWRELKPGCKSLKETLDSARDLLLRISAGDCVNRLKEAEALDTKEPWTTHWISC
ncbi:UL16-binding protein 1 isoform X2 [Desmodus rotundus]|uniref:UL16-binding protein 1 isoform X2 n=1 Tax=Desmodus rotundus TaxID=9430 RepID=UPI001E1BF84C|nr:UL16-binding protein 1 isoform X2 [Desmodus rotundus]